MRGRRGGGGREGGRREGGGGGGDVGCVGGRGREMGGRLWYFCMARCLGVRGVCECGRSVALVYCWSCGDVSTVETE